MNKTTLLFLLVLSTCFSLKGRAQKWRTTDLPPGLMAADGSGNLYFAAYDTGISWKGVVRKGYGLQDICLVSTNCKGDYRWSRIIGGPYVDNPIKLMTDSLGGVYVYGFVRKDPAGKVHVDTDTVLPDNYRSHILVKYDTAGRYQWHIQPGPDTVLGVPSSTSAILDCQVGPAGNVIFQVFCKNGAFADSTYRVTDTLFRSHILEYNADGSFRNGLFFPGMRDDLGSLSLAKLTWDARRDKFYIYAGAQILQADTIVRKQVVLARCSNTGNTEWILQSDDTSLKFPMSGNLSAVAIDRGGDIIMAGNITDSNTFNGYQFINTIDPLKFNRTIPFISRIHADGSPVWTRACGSRFDTYSGGDFTMVYNPPVLAISNNVNSRFDWTNSGHPMGISYGSSMTGGYFVRLDVETNTLLSVDTFNDLSGSTAALSVMCGFNGTDFYLSNDNRLAIPGFDTLNTAYTLIKYGLEDCAPVLSLPATAQPDAVSIYPNPVAGQLFIAQALPGTTATLYTITGKKVYEAAITQPAHSIDISSYTPGMYLLELRQANGVRLAHKIVKW